jgi:hypothetical protein
LIAEKPRLPAQQYHINLMLDILGEAVPESIRFMKTKNVTKSVHGIVNGHE